MNDTSPIHDPTVTSNPSASGMSKFFFFFPLNLVKWLDLTTDLALQVPNHPMEMDYHDDPGLHDDGMFLVKSRCIFNAT